MGNYVLTRPSFVGYITTGSSYVLATAASAGQNTTTAASAGVLTLGSIREISFETTAEILKATSTAYQDATVMTARSGVAGTLTIQLEEITSSALMLAWGASGNASALVADMGSSTPTNWAICSYPWYVDGSACSMVATKCNVQPQMTRKVGKEQEILELKFDVLVDVDASAGKKFVRWLGQS